MDNFNNSIRVPGIQYYTSILINQQLKINKKERTMPKKNRQRSDPIEFNSNKCVFCDTQEDNELKYGKIYQHEGIFTHYYCLLLSSNMQQKGNDDQGILGFLKLDIINELKRGKRLVCSYCKKKGATLGCCNTKCKKIFHLPCGLEAGSFHQFFGEFRTYCIAHRPKQKIDDKIISQQPEQILCYICYDKVDRNNMLETLWAPCCKKNAWFHRTCVQQLAMSAGYFFKCPLCNNKKEFQKAMLDNGIFIPCQDASWELVPNAFEELLYRHNRCDAAQCICTKGRHYTSSNPKWELVLCCTCGSQGVHAACGSLKWVNPTWECNECVSILNKTEQDHHHHHHHSENSNSLLTQNSYNSNNFSGDSSDHSDSDISVGVEEPLYLGQPTVWPTVCQSPEVRMKPGPRSFKIKQEKMLRQSDKNRSKDSENVSSDSKCCDKKSQESISSNVVFLDDDDDNNDDDDDDDDNDEEDRIISITNDNIQPSAMNSLNNNVSGLSGESSTSMIGHIAVGSVDNPTIIAEVQMPTHLYSLPPQDDSVMQIKISNVTSLPPEIFSELSFSETEEPIIEIDSENEEINYHLIQQKNSSAMLAFNTPNVVSDSNEFSQIQAKKLKMVHESPYADDGGVSLENAAIVNVMGKEYVVPLTKTNDMCVSGSDGDAGTKPAMAVQSDEAISGFTNVISNQALRIQYQSAVDQFHQSNASETNGTSDNSNRLKVDTIPMKKLKFRLSGENTVQMTAYDMFTMSLDVDTGNIRNNLNGASLVRRSNSSMDQADMNNFMKSPTKITSTGTAKRNNELARKENVAPITTTTTTANIDTTIIKSTSSSSSSSNSSPTERKLKRQRTNSFVYNNSSTKPHFSILHWTTVDNPGTSRDGLKEIFHTFNNWQNELPIKCDTTGHQQFDWNHSFATTTNKSIDNNVDNFHVSIDLSRIEPLLLSEPNLFRASETNLMMIKNTNKFGSLSNLKAPSTTIENFINNKSFRRSKSLENLSALSAFNNGNEYRSNFEKRGQKRKRRFFDVPD